VGPNLLLLAMVVVVMAAFLGSRAIAGLGITTPAFHLHAAGEQSSEDEALPDEEDPLESVADAADRAALARVEINLYYAPWCPACRAARAWFRARNVPYTGFNVDRDPGAARRLRELSPSGTIPTIEIDGKVVVGFDERQITAVLRTAIAERKKEL
jgi:glutaredoxin